MSKMKKRVIIKGLLLFICGIAIFSGDFEVVYTCIILLSLYIVTTCITF